MEFSLKDWGVTQAIPAFLKKSLQNPFVDQMDTVSDSKTVFKHAFIILG